MSQNKVIKQTSFVDINDTWAFGAMIPYVAESYLRRIMLVIQHYILFIIINK